MIKTTLAQPSGESHRIVYHTFLNLIGLVAPLAAAVFAIPVLMHTLGVERFGLLSLSWAVLGYFSLFDAGMTRSLTKLVSERTAHNRQAEIGSLVLTAMLIVAVISGVLSFLLLLWADRFIANMLPHGGSTIAEASASAPWLSAAVPIVVLTSLLRGTLEGLHRFDLTNLIRVPMGLWHFLGPLGVLYFSQSLEPIIATLVIGRCVFFGLHAWLCAVASPGIWSQLRIDGPAIKPLFKLGGWMTLSNILSPLMSYLDRFALGRLVGAAAVGSYTPAGEISVRAIVIPDAITSVLFPSFSQLFAKRREAVISLFRNSLLATTYLMFILITPVIAAAPELLNIWIGEATAASSAPILKILLIATFINSPARIAFCAIQAAGGASQTAKLHLLEFPLYCVLLIVGIHHWGPIGAATAWLTRVIVDYLVLSYLSHLSLATPRKDWLGSMVSVFAAGLGLSILALLPTFGARCAAAAIGLAITIPMSYRLFIQTRPLVAPSTDGALVASD